MLIEGVGGLGAEVTVLGVEVKRADAVRAADAGELHASLDPLGSIVSHNLIVSPRRRGNGALWSGGEGNGAVGSGSMRAMAIFQQLTVRLAPIRFPEPLELFGPYSACRDSARLTRFCAGTRMIPRRGVSISAMRKSETESAIGKIRRKRVLFPGEPKPNRRLQKMEMAIRSAHVSIGIRFHQAA